MIREIKKIASFPIPTKIIKYQGTKLTKEVKDLHSESCKTPRQEIKDDTNKQKAIPCSRSEELMLLKCPYNPRQSTDSLQSLMKYQ